MNDKPSLFGSWWQVWPWLTLGLAVWALLAALAFVAYVLHQVVTS